MDRIDLRSDTVTVPDEGMRRAMADAPVGDDQYGEDPSVIALQEYGADLLGHEAGLFLPSGTMANQVALKLLTRPGDDVIVGQESHAVFHETGASAALNGVQFTEVGRGGLFTAEDLRAAYKPPGHIIYPPTTLVEVENTHNRGGGLIFDSAEVASIVQTARELNIACYLDGARLFNAVAATGESASDMAGSFDLVAISLSKGLGAPIGSLLAGPRDTIDRAVRYRRMLGGAMRQAGIVAAGGLYALKHNRERLAEDNANAALIARALAEVPGVILDPAEVRTNIVVFHLSEEGPSAPDLVAACREHGVLMMAFTDRMVRLVTHRHVDTMACRRAVDIIARAIDRLGER